MSYGKRREDTPKDMFIPYIQQNMLRVSTPLPIVASLTRIKQHNMETSPEIVSDLANDEHHHSDSRDEFPGPDSNLQKPSSARDTKGANSSSTLPDGIGDQVPDKPYLIFRHNGDHLLVRKRYRHLFKGEGNPKAAPSPRRPETGDINELRSYRNSVAAQMKSRRGHVIHKHRWDIEKQMVRAVEDPNLKQAQLELDSVAAILQTCCAGPDEWRLVVLMQGKLRIHRRFELRTGVKGFPESAGFPNASVGSLMKLLDAGRHAEIPGCPLLSYYALARQGHDHGRELSLKAHSYSPRLIQKVLRPFMEQIGKYLANPPRARSLLGLQCEDASL